MAEDLHCVSALQKKGVVFGICAKSLLARLHSRRRTNKMLAKIAEALL